jgi:MFS family permease
MKIKNISKQVVILGMVSFFTDFASEMLYPVTPLFLTAALGASMVTVGIIEGLAEVTAGILKGYFGALSDKIGKRSIFVVIGYGLSGIVKSLPGFFPFVSTVIFSRVTDRIGKGIRTAPRDALLANYSKGNTGAVFGFHRGMDTLGAVAGPLAALLILSFTPENYTLIFLAAFIPSVFAIGFTLKVKDKKVSQSKRKERHYREFWKSAPREYKILLILITIFSLVNSSDVFLILKSKDIARSDVTAILGYVFYNLIYAGFSFPIGLMADKFGKKNLFVAGLFVFSITYFGFAMNTGLTFIWVLFAFYGIFSASTEGVTKAWVSDLIPDKFRGSGIGLLTTLTSIAVMLGSILAGILWDKFGSTVPFLLSSVVSLIIAVILIFFKSGINGIKSTT